jgi:hypothetical protein
MKTCRRQFRGGTVEEAVCAGCVDDMGTVGGYGGVIVP